MWKLSIGIILGCAFGADTSISACSDEAVIFLTGSDDYKLTGQL